VRKKKNLDKLSRNSNKITVQVCLALALLGIITSSYSGEEKIFESKDDDESLSSSQNVKKQVFEAYNEC
jgi:hypothetical protein